MEREVGAWLHAQLGYNAAADATLSANCRGNLKSLWEFLMSRYMAPDQKRHIQHVLARHRREQEAARRAPERQAEAAQQRVRLGQLQAKAESLHRTLAALQATVDSHIQDAAEQHSEQELQRQELRETQTQVLLLQAYAQRSQQLLPLLQGSLSRLRMMHDMAQARCRQTGRRTQAIQQQLLQVTATIQQELQELLEGQQQQQAAPSSGTYGSAAAAGGAGDDMQQPDQQAQPGVQPRGGSKAGSPACKAGGSEAARGSWGGLAAPDAASAALQLARCSVVGSYSPSPGTQASAARLLLEPPALLMACCSQLAAAACHELAVLLDESEATLLCAHGPDEGEHVAPGACATPGGMGAAPYTCPYTLPWTSGGGGGGGAAAAVQRGGGGGGAAPVELLVKQRQQLHVELFVQARGALAAAKVADAELTRLLGATPALQQGLQADDGGADGAGGWEGRLAGLWVRAEGLRGELGVLQARRADLLADASACRAAEAALQQQWRAIEAGVRDDQARSTLLWQLAGDNLALLAALAGQQQAVRDALQQQHLPRVGAALEAAEAGRDGMVREADALARLPVASMPPQLLAAQGSAAAAAGQPSTLARLQLAAQRLSHLGRATTGPTGQGRPGADAAAAGHSSSSSSSSKASGADAAAVTALKAATSLDAVAPARCPAALLLEVAGQRRQLGEQQQQLEQLSGLAASAAAGSSEAAAAVEQLQQQLAALHTQQRKQVLPRLAALLEEAQQAQAFAKTEVTTDIAHLWEMPAQHLVPARTYEGKSCSDWLMEIQALHARKRELSSQTA